MGRPPSIWHATAQSARCSGIDLRLQVPAHQPFPGSRLPPPTRLPRPGWGTWNLKLVGREGTWNRAGGGGQTGMSLIIFEIPRNSSVPQRSSISNSADSVAVITAPAPAIRCRAQSRSCTRREFTASYTTCT